MKQSRTVAYLGLACLGLLATSPLLLAVGGCPRRPPGSSNFMQEDRWV
jgi:hypothetical protein